jgi:hypothetical protein
MEILTTLWIVSKYALLAASISLLIAVLFSLFHPIYLKLNFRTTIKGQRAEFWLLYFFKSLRIGVIATPHTQDVLVRFLFWEKIIQRNSKISKKPLVSAPPTSNSDFGKSQSEPVAPCKSESKPATETKDLERPDTSMPIDEPEVVHEETKATKVEPIKHTETTFNEPVEKESAQSRPDTSEIDSKSEVPDKPYKEEKKKEPTSSPASVEQAEEAEEVIPKPLSEVEKDFAENMKKSEEQASSEKEIPLRKRLANLKKLISKKYSEGKGWIRFGLNKWKIVKPIFTRFWERSKAGFSIINPGLKCRYALHEPYITGMFQGSMAILAGIFARAGVEFVPIPEFTAPMIYVKGRAGAKIRPWKFLWAAIGIILEPQLWKEGYHAFKWYRAKRRTEAKL